MTLCPVPCGALIWRESWADLVFLMKWAQMNRNEAFNFVISFSIGWEPYTLSLWYLSSSFRCINIYKSLWYLSSFRCINIYIYLYIFIHRKEEERYQSESVYGSHPIEKEITKLKASILYLFIHLFIYLFWRVCVCVLASIMNNVEKTLGSQPDQIRDKWPAVSSTDKDRMTRPENWALNSTMKPQRVISVMESQTKLMFTVQF